MLATVAVSKFVQCKVQGSGGKTGLRSRQKVGLDLGQEKEGGDNRMLPLHHSTGFVRLLLKQDMLSAGVQLRC